jgi:hypothetical protein
MKFLIVQLSPFCCIIPSKINGKINGVLHKNVSDLNSFTNTYEYDCLLSVHSHELTSLS